VSSDRRRTTRATRSSQSSPTLENDAVLGEVEQLKQAGHLRAAMTAWAALEPTGRAPLRQDLARPQPANKLIEALASERAVPPAEADSLPTAMGLRNAGTHGHFSVSLTEQEVDRVTAAAKLITGLAKEPISPWRNRTVPALQAYPRAALKRRVICTAAMR